MKWINISRLLYDHRIPITLKGKFYNIIIRPSLVQNFGLLRSNMFKEWGLVDKFWVRQKMVYGKWKYKPISTISTFIL